MADPTQLIVVIGIVVVGLVALAAIGFLVQRRREPAPREEIDLDTAWGAWFGDGDAWTERERAAVERLQARGDTAAAALKRTLGEMVQSVLADAEPQVALRRAIMDAADQVVLVETLDPDSPMGDEAVDNTVTVGVLRRFAGMRFHDQATDDWFSHYVQVAAMNARNVASMVRKTVDGQPTTMESALHDPLAGAMRQIRERLLRYPARVAVSRGDELTDPGADDPLEPTAQQIERLTDAMRRRLEQLFAGQVYNLPTAPPLNPVGAFHVDAGLLYALLANRFRQPREAWRTIVGQALGPQGALGETELFEHATAFARAWAEADDDPLGTAMAASWSLAFDVGGAGGAGGAATNGTRVDEATIVGGMVEQAGPLVAAIEDVIEPTTAGA